MKIDRERMKSQFEAYVSSYNMDDPKIRLKYEHTFFVAKYCEKIAESLDLSDEDIDLAWTLGIFHDIGRFEQLRRFQTFRDGISINHAALSADLLFQDGLIADYLDVTDLEEEILLLIEKAVRYHNAFRLPENFTDREKLFADILRDADKVDILRVNCETPRTEIYNLPEEDFLYSDMTDEVYEALLTNHEVDRQYSRTGIDFMMGHIAFVYGLVFEESKKMVTEQGYLEQMLSFDSKNPKTQERIVKIRDTIHTWMRNS